MKKIRLLVFILLLVFVISGCKKNEVMDNDGNAVTEEKFVLEKNEEDKEFVYLEPYRELKLEDGKDYLLEIAVINIKSDDVANVNLELSSFVKKSYKDMVINEGRLVRGNVIYYAYEETNQTVSVMQKYYPYIDGVLGEEKSNVYVVSKETGRVLSKEEVLKMFSYNVEEFFQELEHRLDSEDVLYTMMNIKNNGYDLYINGEENLVVIYNEVSEEESIRKELILE